MNQIDYIKYLWKGLDYNKYEVIKIIPQNYRFAAIIMRSRNPDDTHWCIEYRGNGHYFSTIDEMKYFYKKKFKKLLEL